MQRTLDLFERVILYALIVPVVVIVIDAVLGQFNANESNSIVNGIDAIADAFTFEVFETMFPDQSPLLTAFVALVIYGVVVLLVLLLFKVLKSATAPKAPSKRP